MPLVTRRIETSYAYVDSEKYAKLARFHVLQGTNTASLVGALEQIGLLADYATEIFNDIYKFSCRLNDRIGEASTRTSSLLKQLPDVKEQLNSKDLNIYSTVSMFKQGEQYPETAMLLPTSKPRTLQLYYDSPAMGRIPAVSEMDALLPPEELASRGPCANSYSYPGFFLDEWKKAEAERRKVLEAERQRRRKERAERKLKLKQLKEREVQSTKSKEKKSRLDWRERLSAGPRTSDVPAPPSVSEPPKPEVLFKRVFQEVDDEDDADAVATPPPPPVAAPPSVPPPIPAPPMAPPPPLKAPAVPSSMPPPPPGKAPGVPAVPTPTPSGAPPPLPSGPPPLPSAAPPAPPQTAPPPLPANVPPPLPSSLPPPIPAGPPPTTPAAAPPSPPAPPRGPAPPPPTSPPISPPVSPNAPTSAPPPPTLQPPRPSIPPPPLSDDPPVARPPNPFGNNDDARNNLLASITQGKKLRASKEEPAPVKQLPGAPKVDMLTAIRRGSVLRKVETNAPKPPQRKESLGAFSGDAVASILARRKHLQADDTESDDDDDDEW